MKRAAIKLLAIGLAVLLGSFVMLPQSVWAEETEEAVTEERNAASTSISISPVSKILQLLPNTTYDDVFVITNNGSGTLEFETYASPYSYSYSETDDEYKLGFSTQNNYTQITRWITFKDTEGNYKERARYKVPAGESIEVSYRIKTPASIPNGGQYAVLFARTISSDTAGSGIRTEASPGLVVYGRSNGETIVESEIRNLSIGQTLERGEDKKTTVSLINAAAKIKNNGNVDFTAQGELKVENLFGQTLYRTTGTRGLVSVIPETELTISDVWEETPYFGFFRTTWTVTAAGKTETISKLIMILPIPVLVAVILLLTFIIIWIIILVRKRKERRSRFMI